MTSSNPRGLGNFKKQTEYDLPLQNKSDVAHHDLSVQCIGQKQWHLIIYSLSITPVNQDIKIIFTLTKQNSCT